MLPIRRLYLYLAAAYLLTTLVLAIRAHAAPVRLPGGTQANLPADHCCISSQIRIKVLCEVPSTRCRPDSFASGACP